MKRQIGPGLEAMVESAPQQASAPSRRRASACPAQLVGARRAYGPVLALDDVDLTVSPGEVLALLGPNGAGKSTAIGLMTGRLRPDAGTARVFGHDPTLAPTRRLFGVMLQSAELPETLRVGELVDQARACYPTPRSRQQVIELAGLDGLQARAYERLSGGQKRRVQFALAVCGRPPLLFIDEPSTGLDPVARRRLWAAVGAMRDEGTAVVLTTHYLEEADALADRVMLIDRGRILAEGSPEAIKRRAAGVRVRCRTRVTANEAAVWPEVSVATRDGNVLDLECSKPEPVVRRLLAADAALEGLEVRPGSLEQAVHVLTRQVGEAA